MTERIVAAACLYGGEVWSVPAPGRHRHVIAKHYAETGQTGSGDPGGQGFVTSTGRYVDRLEGLEIALAAGQVLIKTPGVGLFSEDLW